MTATFVIELCKKGGATKKCIVIGSCLSPAKICERSICRLVTANVISELWQKGELGSKVEDVAYWGRNSRVIQNSYK